MKIETFEFGLQRGVCPGCGTNAFLTVFYTNGPQRIFVCDAACWSTNFAAKLGPLEDEGPALQSARIEYKVRPRTSYPIPAGFRMLSDAERIEPGDKIWSGDEFVYASINMLGQPSPGFICAIRSTAGTVFDERLFSQLKK